MKHPFPVGTLCKLNPITKGGSPRLSAYVDKTEELFDNPYGDLTLMSVYRNETFMVLGNVTHKNQWTNIGDISSFTLILHPFHGPVWINTILIAKI